MVNAYWQPLTFKIQEGVAGSWWRMVDTGRSAPDDFVDPGNEVQISSLEYSVQSRSLVVLMKK